MLKIKSLTCGYGGAPVINKISFDVQPEEKLCVLGANGSGKTTLLRGIAGLIKVSGSVLLDGNDILKLSPAERAKYVAVMSQFSPSTYGYTAYETVAMGRYVYGKKSVFGGYSECDKRIVEESMKNTDVWSIKDRLITRLSGGQTQRVFLARAFAQEPSVLLLDEPMNHLDLKARCALTEILSEWVTEKRRAIIGVFHDLSPALIFSDSTLLLHNGAMVTKQSVQNLDFDLLNKIYDMDVRVYMRGLAKIWM